MPNDVALAWRIATVKAGNCCKDVLGEEIMGELVGMPVGGVKYVSFPVMAIVRDDGRHEV